MKIQLTKRQIAIIIADLDAMRTDDLDKKRLRILNKLSNKLSDEGFTTLISKSYINKR